MGGGNTRSMRYLVAREGGRQRSEALESRSRGQAREEVEAEVQRCRQRERGAGSDAGATTIVSYHRSVAATNLLLMLSTLAVVPLPLFATLTA